MLSRLFSAISRWLNDEPVASQPALREAPAVREEVKITGGAAEATLGSLFPKTVEPGGPSLSTETEQSATESEQSGVLVQREVLDVNLAVVGYDFSLREDLRAGTHAGSRPVKDFLARMLVDQLAALDASLFRHRVAHLQLGERAILRLGIGKFPARANILVSPENAQSKADSGTREAIHALRQSGREVWLDDCLGTPWANSLADIATGVTVRVALRMPNEMADLIQTSREKHPGLRYGAWDVSTYEDFNLARSLGCKRFSGKFVTQREDWGGKEMSPQMLQVAQLINKVREEADMRAIADVLKQDMALSYRLLRYVNNAAYGLNHKIASIEQGLMVLGQDQLDRWLTLLLLSGGALGSTALTEIALTRARFLELVGAGRCSPEQCERLFVLGLFSMLDVALKIPLETALQPLHLPEDMQRALMKREGLLGSYLSLADACERGISNEIIKYAVMLGLTTNKVTTRQIEALDWVAKVTAQIQGGTQ